MRDEAGAADNGADSAADSAMGSPPEPASGGVVRGTSRRWFLAAGAAVLAGGGGGVGAAFLRHPPRRAPNPPPQLLLEAYVAEQRLIESARATGRADPGLTARLDQLHRDHAAHLAAVRAALARYDRPDPAARRRAARSAGTVARTASALQAAEQQASVRAASRATDLARAHAALAPLFASISACEATHARLLR
jgi:hypothetical protein